MEPEKGIGLSASRGPELKLSLDLVLCPREQGQQTAGSWKDPESSPQAPRPVGVLREHRPSLTRPHGAFCNVTAKVPEERLLARMY